MNGPSLRKRRHQKPVSWELFHNVNVQNAKRIAELEAELRTECVHCGQPIPHVHKHESTRELALRLRAEKAEAEVERLTKGLDAVGRKPSYPWKFDDSDPNDHDSLCHATCPDCGSACYWSVPRNEPHAEWHAHESSPGSWKHWERLNPSGGRESGERRRGTVNRDEAPPGIIGGSQTAAIPAVPCTEPRCIREDPHDIPFGCKNLSEDEASEAKHLLWLRKDAARKERASSD